MDDNYKEKIKRNIEAGLAKESKSLIGFFIRNFRFTYLIVFAILILGLFSLVTLPREADPEVKIPFAIVTTIYPGATPTDVEELVTNKIEDKVKNLEDLKQFNSFSGQGYSNVSVEFNAEADLKDSIQKLKDKVDEARTGLPTEVEDSIVTEIRVNDFPVVTYSLVSDEIDRAGLKKYADMIQDELEDISGVSKAEMVGALEREFQVIVDQTKLASYNLSISQIVSAIARTNFNLPAGNIEIDGFKYNIRVKGKFEAVEALNNVVITTSNNVPIYLDDVALIKDGFKEKKSEARIGFSNTKSYDTISLQVYKKTGGNIIKIVQAADATIEKFNKGDKLPKSLKIEKTDDNAFYIKDSLNTLGMSGLQTMILIIILLFLVLGIRGALITGLSVPIAFLMAFVFLNFQGETLNSIVLYSLVISLGLMVDNSIIIMEGINEYITRHGKNPLEAALLSVWNFKWAITSGTMTTVSAFAPMLLVSGILGEYFSFIPKTISATLISSLFVALVVIPTLSARFIKVKNNNNNNNNNNKEANGYGRRISKRYQKCANLVGKIKCKYKILMHYLLPEKKRRRKFLAICWTIFFLAVLVPILGLMKIQMFPPIDYRTIYVTVELPIGSILDSTKEVAIEVEKYVAQVPELNTYVTNLGNKLSFMGGGGSGSHLATVLVNLVPENERDRRSSEVAEELRQEFKIIQGGKIEVEEVSAGPPTGAPIEVRIYGDDNRGIAQVAKQFIFILEKIPGTVNVRDSIEDATGEFTFTINKEKASYYSLDIAQVAATLRNAIYGAKASSMTINGEDIDITVKYNEEKLKNIESVENIFIFTPSGQNIPLKQIADLKIEPSLSSVNHRDGENIVTVSANLENKANLQDILAEFNKQKNDVNLPDNIRVNIGGEVEDIEQSYRETFYSMIVAVILIAFILVLQFNSFRQPFIILTALPLAVIGVIIGLNILRMPFSFPAFLGIVALAGIAVNDAIVLIDRINKNLRTGMSQIEGIIEAGLARMQPIFLTSLTTIAGVFPLVFADEIWRGFSVTLICGLIFSTALTLVVVPLLYVGFTRKDRFAK